MSDSTEPNDAADRAWFHAQVDPVVGAVPIDDAWPDISARADGAPAPAAPGRSGAARWVAAAAVVALLAGIAVVIAATRGDDATSVTADQPGEPTGWYVPAGLPDGWTLVSAWVIDDPTLCTKLERSWSDPRMVDPGQTLTLTFDACGTTRSGALAVDPSALGDEVDMVAADDLSSKPGSTVLRWQTDDGAWELRLSASGSPEERLARLGRAARAVIANPLDARAPLPDLVDTSYSYLPGSGTGPTVTVQLRAPGTRLSPDQAHVLTYRLSAPGTGPAGDPFSVNEPVDPADLPNQPLPVTLRTANWEADQPGLPASSSSRYLGAWPGADVDVPRWGGTITTDDDAAPADAAAAERLDTAAGKIEAATLVEALRPASTEVWRSYLATAEERVDPDLLSATDLASLVATPDHESATTQPERTPTTAPAATTTDPTTPQATTSTAPGTPGIISEPGVAVPNDQPSPMYSSLDGLEFRLELPTTTIRAGGPVKGTLLIRNTTDAAIVLNECTHGFTRWGLVPVGSPEDPLLVSGMIDCFDTPVLTVPAAGTGRYPISSGGENDFRAQTFDPAIELVHLGTLPGGRYLAVVEIPGDDTTVRIELPVTVPEPPCPTSDGVAKAYLDLTRAEAKDRAEADGLLYREVRVDGEDQATTLALRCNRINVDLAGGRVRNALLY